MTTTTTLVTDLAWNSRACKNGNTRRRGALEGTLLGVPVNGRTIGKGVAFQFGLITGEVRTAWWDGTLHYGSPCLFDIDTHEPLSFSPEAFVWFDLLANVS
jgi:hypothetical protein